MPRSRPRLSRDAIVVVVLAAVLAVLAGGIWVTGGFARAEATMGQQKAADTVFRGQRWDLQFGEAVIELSSEEIPTLSVMVTGQYKGEATASSPGQGVVRVRLPDGRTVSDPTWLTEIGFGEPGVTGPARLQIELPELAPGEMPVEIGVYDERRAGSFISADRWVPAAPLGHVELTAADLR